MQILTIFSASIYQRDRTEMIPSKYMEIRIAFPFGLFAALRNLVAAAEAKEGANPNVILICTVDVS